MLYTLLSWIVIGISAFLWGFGVLFVLGKVNNYHDKSIDLSIMTGLCALTVYAQIFSLFYKIGMMALSGVFFLDAIWLFFIYKEFINWIKGIKKLKQGAFLPIWQIMAIGVGVITLVAALVSSGGITLVDTNLYHAQAIRWIEEYGVVPGLGNLHKRLAYNSSFLCLQALFSFRPLIGPSMHSMNGFVMCLIVSYAVCSMKFWRNRKIYASDFIRIALISYYADAIYDISSPGTDAFAVALIGYIVCKWVTFLEEDEKKVAPYAYLCILGVYAVSLKVSSVMIVLLVIMPAYRLIAEKKWKEILLYMGMGILTIAPFLIRNVILSGYLLYPYPELDFFSFDWKIPIEYVDSERTEIRAWAQGFRGQYENKKFAEWFPLWRDSILLPDSRMLIEFIADIAAIPISLIVGVVKGLQKKNWYFLHISFCLTIGILFWFFNAPSRRFGETYLIILPLYLIGSIIENLKSKKMAVVVTAVVFVILGDWGINDMVDLAVANAKWSNKPYMVVAADYDYFSCKAADIGGLEVYYPDPDSDTPGLTGYHFFPGTPFESNLTVIELRGESFAEGFRYKSVE